MLFMYIYAIWGCSMYVTLIRVVGGSKSVTFQSILYTNDLKV